jgi:predicted membrane-bound spermidine synthase
MVWNAPPMTLDPARSGGTYSFIQVTHVAIIAFAGIIGNARLVQLLRELSGDRAIARRVLVAWLAVNLFLGSQLCWILRPFIGSPGLPVEFLRAAAFQGNFYETVFHSLLRLVNVD